MGTRRSGRPKEKAIVDKIDFDRICGEDAAKLLKLVMKKGLLTDKAAQDNVALGCRAMSLKLRLVKAISALKDFGETSSLFTVVNDIKREHAAQFDKAAPAIDLGEKQIDEITVKFVKAADGAPG